MVNSEVLVNIERSHNGDVPCIWETGGSYGMTGMSRVVCNHNGQPKKPLAIKRNPCLACQDHALFAVRPGDYIIVTNRWENKFSVDVMEIKDIIHTARCQVVYRFDTDASGWEDGKEPHAMLHAVIGIALQKSMEHQCKVPYYYREDKAHADQIVEADRLAKVYDSGRSHYALVRSTSPSSQVVQPWA